ncbi:MAG TPA: hypothetical protein DEO71_17550 [Chryseobacterium sp.]|nr:hypothetical protein [Chryseobacterium sp.]
MFFKSLFANFLKFFIRIVFNLLFSFIRDFQIKNSLPLNIGEIFYHQTYKRSPAKTGDLLFQ